MYVKSFYNFNFLIAVSKTHSSEAGPTITADLPGWTLVYSVPQIFTKDVDAINDINSELMWQQLLVAIPGITFAYTAPRIIRKFQEEPQISGMILS